MAQEIRAMPEEMDPELWRGFQSATPAWQGRLAAIFVTPESMCRGGVPPFSFIPIAFTDS